MTVCVTTVAMDTDLGQWYGRGAARLAESLSGQADVLIHHRPPDGTPDLREDRLYAPYIAKPYALREAARQADVAILCDASFYAIHSIQPLVDHILKVGYYLCRNGSTVGEWTSDGCLAHFGVDRDAAMEMHDVSSYCVGIDTRFGRPGMRLMDDWCYHSTRATIVGAHTNWPVKNRRSRNPGWVSQERRVRGHRHDQSVLSLVANNLGLHEWVSRPKFTTYKGSETEETVLVCEGMS